MKNIVLFVGREFAINKEFASYVAREALKKIATIDAILFVHEKDKNLLVQISKAYEEYDKMLIVTSNRSFATVSKIIATLFEDNLVAKEHMLTPSKATKVQKNSFLLEFDKQINVIKASIGNTLPPILLHSTLESTNLFVFGLEEEQIIEELQPLAKSYEIELGLSQETKNLYKVFAYNKKYGDLAMFVQNVKLKLPQNIIITPNVFEYLIERFTSIKKTITFAESCTGGLLASLLTKIPGSSNIFHGSLVTYANTIKHAWLGVKEETLQKYGAVSEETVEEMLRGALKVSKADYAIAISGIAGPGGATPTKPVGTVVVGCMDKEKAIIETMHFEGDRNYIQYQAAMYGVFLLFTLAKEDLF